MTQIGVDICHAFFNIGELRNSALIVSTRSAKTRILPLIMNNKDTRF